jgi:hypothetical protein
MISVMEMERLKQEAYELGRYSIHVAVALSLICSLVAVAIISKKNPTNYLLADLAAFAIPIPIALYFRQQIVWFGAALYVGVLILALAAAVMFGI